MTRQYHSDSKSVCVHIYPHPLPTHLRPRLSDHSLKLSTLDIIQRSIEVFLRIIHTRRLLHIVRFRSRCRQVTVDEFDEAIEVFRCYLGAIVSKCHAILSK